jgi:hypothetical protein
VDEQKGWGFGPPLRILCQHHSELHLLLMRKNLKEQSRHKKTGNFSFSLAWRNLSPKRKTLDPSLSSWKVPQVRLRQKKEQTSLWQLNSTLIHIRSR